MSYWVDALELLLLLRLLLQLTAANASNQVAKVIYDWSEPFVNPFTNLFSNPTFSGGDHVLDLNVLAAMAAYLVITRLLMGLVQLL